MNAKIPVNINTRNFTYARAAVKITAYDKEYELPVRTTEFCCKQDAVDRKITDTSEERDSADVAMCIREGIALYIGEEETERIFPKADIQKLDIDELNVFYNFLKDSALANFIEYTKKYSPIRLKR